MATHAFESLLGVYDADGGLLGEARYVLGKLRGTSHCGLCDITHSSVRRKKEWNALVNRFDAPIKVVHRNELPAGAAADIAKLRLPVVVGLTAEGGCRCLLSADALDSCAGSVADFEAALAKALAAPSVGSPGEQ